MDTNRIGSRGSAPARISLACCLVAVLLAAAPDAHAVRWRRAYVVDPNLAALRTEPDPMAPLRTRLRTGRMVAIVARARGRDGLSWVRVAVTRRTRGWLPADAIAVPGDIDDERRLLWLMELSVGATASVRSLELAKLAIDHFPNLYIPGEALRSFETRAVAEELTDRAATRFAAMRSLPRAELRRRMLMDPMLDRYVRLGVELDAVPERLAYVPGTNPVRERARRARR